MILDDNLTDLFNPADIPFDLGEENLTLPPLNLVPNYTAGLIYGFTGNNHLDELEVCM